MKLWWFTPFSTNIRSCVDDDRNLWKFHQNHDNDAQAHRTLAATLDIWPCDGRVPLSKEKRKEKSTETKPDRVLPSTVPSDVCMSSSLWGRENTQPPLRFRLCLGYDLLTSDPFKLCRGSSHRPGGGRRTSTFSTELLGDVSTHQCAPQFASCIIWVSAPQLTLSLSCATNCRKLACPCWSPGIFSLSCKCLLFCTINQRLHFLLCCTSSFDLRNAALSLNRSRSICSLVPSGDFFLSANDRC